MSHSLFLRSLYVYNLIEMYFFQYFIRENAWEHTFLLIPYHPKCTPFFGLPHNSFSHIYALPPTLCFFSFLHTPQQLSLNFQSPKLILKNFTLFTPSFLRVHQDLAVCLFSISWSLGILLEWLIKYFSLVNNRKATLNFLFI